MINLYNITKNNLNSKEFESEALYYVTDTGEVYFDSPLEAARVEMSSNLVLVGSLPIAPIPNKIYAVLETGTLHMYINGDWLDLGRRPQLHFYNVIIHNGILNITDEKIASTDAAQFVPDLSIQDLAGTISATCKNGSVSVTSTSEYDIPGVVIVN